MRCVSHLLRSFVIWLDLYSHQKWMLEVTTEFHGSWGLTILGDVLSWDLEQSMRDVSGMSLDQDELERDRSTSTSLWTLGKVFFIFGLAGYLTCAGRILTGHEGATALEAALIGIIRRCSRAFCHACLSAGALWNAASVQSFDRISSTSSRAPWAS